MGNIIEKDAEMRIKVIELELMKNKEFVYN